MADNPLVGAWELSGSGVGIAIYTGSLRYRTGTQESSAVGWRPSHAQGKTATLQIVNPNYSFQSLFE